MAKNTIAAPEQREPDAQNAIAVRSGGAAAQNTVRNIRLIIGHEYKKRVTQRSFIISTIIILILIVIGSFVPTIIEYIVANTHSQTRVTLVNNAGTVDGMSGDALTHYVDTSLNGTANSSPGQGTPQFAITTPSATTPDAINSLKSQVKKGSLAILLVIDRATDANGDLQFTYYTTSSVANDSNITQIQNLATQLSLLDKSSRLGLTPAQTSQLFQQPQFNPVNLGQQSTRSVSDIVAGYIIAYAGIILIFMSVFLYGVGVANGVAEEKGSRIMEILVNAATPFQLMAGKIVGIGAAGLTQMSLFVVVGISMLLLQIPIQAVLLGSNAGGLSLNITSTSITLLILLLVYFILGFLLYATLFAAMGALVKRQDEVQNAVQPLTWLFMVGYFVSFFGISAPDATWIKVISYIPFWTPTTMLMRIGTGSVAWWEIALTIVLMMIAIFLCAGISARIYRYGILMYGQKPGLRQLFKLVRAK